MLTSFLKIPTKLGILLVGFGLLVVGCDSAGPSSDDGEEAKAVSYEVTNNLGSRVTHVGDDASSSDAQTAAAKGASFQLLAQITPPDIDNDGTTTERASHVTYNGNRLYVGHMLRGDGPGNGFNGGTDIIDVSNPNNPDGFGTGSGSRANALQVENVDVQESAVFGNTLFLGVAEEPSLPGEVGSTPAEVHSIRLNNAGYPATSGGEVDFEQREVDANLIKSVTVASGNSNNQFYATTDGNELLRFDVNTSDAGISGVTQELANTNTEFRGVGATARGGFALSKNSNNGNGYLWKAENGGGLTNVKNLGAFTSFGGGIENSIARVTTGGPNCNGDDLVFASMNRDGFRVFKTNAGGGVTRVFSNPTLDVTSVTATENYVYVASGEEIAVFRVTSNICNTNPDEGLSKIGKRPVEGFANAGAFNFASGGAQVNDIAAWGDYLAIAMGRNGVFVVKTDSGTYP